MGSVYSMVWMFYYMFKDFRKFIKEFKAFNKKWLYTSLIVFVISSVGLFFGFIGFLIFLLGCCLLLINVLFVVGKISEKLYMYKIRKVSKLVEGDWIGKNIEIKGEVIFSKGDVLDEEGLKKLKSLGLKEILIKEGIAFVPGILLGVLVSFVLGNWFFV